MLKLLFSVGTFAISGSTTAPLPPSGVSSAISALVQRISCLNGLKSRIHGGTHPTIAELVDFWQLCQHSSQYRIEALLLDPLAMAKSQTADVFRRNQLLQDEMNNFANHLSVFPVAYIDVMNYLDRVCAIGIVPQQI
jgi:hypothetical protein